MLRLAALLITSFILLAGCADKRENLDRDEDGIEDRDETEGVTIQISTAQGTEMRRVTSDPGNADTDGDGLLDGDEMLARGTDPRSADTDGDGLLDGRDVHEPPEALASSWRSARIIEVNRTFLGELDACPRGGPQLKPFQYSSDLPLADELGDGDELRGWDVTVRGATRHVTSDPCTPDGDNDGLRDHDERRFATDPRDDDTDGDGARDGSDGDPLWDLGLRFGPLVVERANGTGAARLKIGVAGAEAGLNWPGDNTVRVDVVDLTPDRSSLQVSVILAAEDLQSGEPLALFADPRGQIVVFDLLRDVVEGLEAQADPHTLRFTGADGSLSLTWAVDRA